MATQLTKREKDIFRLIQSGCHLGTPNCNVQMRRFVHSVEPRGASIYKIDETYEKILLAARIIAGVQNPKEVYAISSRTVGQRAVIKLASAIGCSSEASLRWTPGSLTNYITKNFKEPSLIIVADPFSDFKAIKEASFCNIPVIALCDSMSNLKFVDVAIPCNTKRTQSVAMVLWTIAKEVKILRGELEEDDEWDMKVELFYAMNARPNPKEEKPEGGEGADEDEAEEGENDEDAEGFEEANN